MPVTPDSVKLMGVVDDPLHKVWSVGLVTAGVGLMVMVNVLAVPGQVLPAFVKLGVTVILPVMGALVVLVPINDAISPVPLAPKPMLVLSLVQLNTVPETPEPVNVIAAVGEPLHTV